MDNYNYIANHLTNIKKQEDYRVRCGEWMDSQRGK